MWYSARLHFHEEVEDGRLTRPLTDDRLILVQADSVEDAENKALEFAKEMEEKESSVDEEPVVWRFTALLDIFNTCEQEAISGIELYSITYGHEHE